MIDVTTPRRILMLYYWDDRNPTMRPAIRQHLQVLDNSAERHHLLYHNVAYGVPGWLKLIGFDAVILHTTLLCYRWSSLFPKVQKDLAWLRACDCLKIAMPQDEYDHSEILDEWLSDLNVAIVCSNFDERFRSVLYPRMHMRARFLKCLTGYIDMANAATCQVKSRPMAERPLDIVYRAAHLPYWFGSQGQLKHEIATIVDRRARELGMACDISTRDQDAITGNNWYDFLASGRTIIGCESGSSVLDTRGGIQAQIRAWLAQNPNLTFAEVCKKLPAGWDEYRFFALGPRHLEAIVTRTCQVLIEGDYDGVLRPDRHYLSLRRDFGNLDEILHKIKDHALLETIANRAYEDVFESKKYTYGELARVLDAELAAAPRQSALLPWSCLKPWHAGGLMLRRMVQPLFAAARRLHPRHWPGLGIRKLLRGALKTN